MNNIVDLIRPGFPGTSKVCIWPYAAGRNTQQSTSSAPRLMLGTALDRRLDPTVAAFKIADKLSMIITRKM